MITATSDPATAADGPILATDGPFLVADRPILAADGPIPAAVGRIHDPIDWRSTAYRPINRSLLQFHRKRGVSAGESFGETCPGDEIHRKHGVRSIEAVSAQAMAYLYFNWRRSGNLRIGETATDRRFHRKRGVLPSLASGMQPYFADSHAE